MQIKVLEQCIDYDGSQLRPHWIYQASGVLGDSLVAFTGRCDVKVDKLVDLVDAHENRPIFSERMLHLIGEFFDADLLRTIYRQRLLVSLAQQEIVFRSKRPTIIRGGNDLYDEGLKLSVSIATASPVSTLLHFGINISSKGTPVPTKGLDDYGIEPLSFARSLLETFRNEMRTANDALAKVRAVY